MGKKWSVRGEEWLTVMPMVTTGNRQALFLAVARLAMGGHGRSLCHVFGSFVVPLFFFAPFRCTWSIQLIT